MQLRLRGDYRVFSYDATTTYWMVVIPCIKLEDRLFLLQFIILTISIRIPVPHIRILIYPFWSWQYLLSFLLSPLLSSSSSLSSRYFSCSSCSFSCSSSYFSCTSYSCFCSSSSPSSISLSSAWSSLSM